MPARRTRCELIQQFFQLRSARLRCEAGFQPVPQQIRLACAPKQLQWLDDQNLTTNISGSHQVICPKLAQQLLRLCSMRGRAGKRVAEVRKNCLQDWQDPSANLVAGKTLICVAGVFNKVSALQCKPVANVAATHAQQRPMKLNASALPAPEHGSDPWQPRTSAKRQKDGLDLVISMLRECQSFGLRWVLGIRNRPTLYGQTCECAVSRPPRSIFGALADIGTGGDLSNGQRYFEMCTYPFAMALKIISSGLQAMMDMNSTHLAGPFLMAGQQQGG